MLVEIHWDIISMSLNLHVDKLSMRISFHGDVAFFNSVWINGRRINLVYLIRGIVSTINLFLLFVLENMKRYWKINYAGSNTFHFR